MDVSPKKSGGDEAAAASNEEERTQDDNMLNASILYPESLKCHLLLELTNEISFAKFFRKELIKDEVLSLSVTWGQMHEAYVRFKNESKKDKEREARGKQRRSGNVTSRPDSGKAGGGTVAGASGAGSAAAGAGARNGDSARGGELVCFHCQEVGHRRNQCPNRNQPKKDAKVGAFSVVGPSEGVLSDAKGSSEGVPSAVLLLDNCAQYSVVRDPGLLSDLARVESSIEVVGANGGSAMVKGTGTFNGFNFPIGAYYVPDAAHNLISERQVELAIADGKGDLFRGSGVTVVRCGDKAYCFSSRKAHVMELVGVVPAASITRAGGKYVVAHQAVGEFTVQKMDTNVDGRLIKEDPSEIQDIKVLSKIRGLAMYKRGYTSLHQAAVQRYAKANATKHDKEMAKESRELQARMGFLSDDSLSHMLARRRVLGTEVQPAHVRLAKALLGHSYSLFAAKAVEYPEYRNEPVPTGHLSYRVNQFFACDTFFISKIPFLLGYAAPVGKVYVKLLPNEQAESAQAVVQEWLNDLQNKGFRVLRVKMDSQILTTVFEGIADGLADASTSDSHAYSAETIIRRLKERIRAVIADRNTPWIGAFLFEIVDFACESLNLVSPRRTPDASSPFEIWSGEIFNVDRHRPCAMLDIVFFRRAKPSTASEYANVHRKRGGLGICLSFNGDAAGSINVLSLEAPYSIHKVSKFQIVNFDEHKHRIHDAIRDRMVGNELPNPINFYSRNYDLEAAVDVDQDFVEDEIGYLPLKEVVAVSSHRSKGTNANKPPAAGGGQSSTLLTSRGGSDAMPSSLVATRGVSDQSGLDATDKQRTKGPSAQVLQKVGDLDRQRNHEGTRASLRTRQGVRHKDPDFLYAYSAIFEQAEFDVDLGYQIGEAGLGTGMRIQVLAAKVKPSGSQSMGQAVDEALKTGREVNLSDAVLTTRTEDRVAILTSLEDEINALVLTSGDGGTNSLTPVEEIPTQSKPLSLQALVKYKYLSSGEFERVKSRICINGARQDKQLFLTSELNSPTAAQFSWSSIGIIGVQRRWGHFVIDIRRAYLNAVMKDPSGAMYAVAPRALTRQILRMYPGFKKFEKDGKMYFLVNKAVYGAIQSARLWFDKISAELFQLGFKQNQYDDCVFYRHNADGVVIIALHVDDIFGTASSDKASELFFQQLNKVFPDGIKLSQGDKLNYLGREIDFSKPGSMIVSMQKYVEDCTRGVSGVNKTPADLNLFRVDEKSELLTEDVKEEFHSTVAKLLYLAMAFRADISVAVSFLCSRVQSPTQQDMKKLLRVQRYLNSTKNYKQHLEPNGLQVSVSIDASHQAWDDLRGHSGIVLMIGGAVVYARSLRQKSHSNSSTETEILAVSQKFSEALWLLQFLEDLPLGAGEGVGSTPGPILLEQDNQSTIQLYEKGTAQRGKSKHIQARHFWIYHLIEQGVVRLVYVSTDKIVADVLTKALSYDIFMQHVKKLGFVKE